MILFPYAKINLGLQIVGVRPDGYHDISTVMVPVMWRDILELTPARGPETTLTTYGRAVDCLPEKNLVMKAYRAMCAFTGGLPPVDFHLDKRIPDGAGMGGGSADAAFAIRGLNELFNLGLDDDTLARVAVTVGADCPFFIYNRPALCQGIGDRITLDVHPALDGHRIIIVKPRVASVSTKEAYDNAVCTPGKVDLPSIVEQSPAQWRGRLVNDFESSVFPRLPLLAETKQRMYDSGAAYASMTGSGAAIYGIFDDDKLAQTAYDNFADCDKIAL